MGKRGAMLFGRRLLAQSACLSTVFATACVSPSGISYVAADPANVLTITAVSKRPPAASGTLAFYLKVDAKAADGAEKVFYRAYLDPDEPLPKVGLRCRFITSTEDIEGFLGDALKSERRLDATIIDEFFCWRARSGARWAEKVR